MTAPASHNRRAGLRSLRHRDFRVIALGNMTSQMGSWVQYVAVGWVARDLTSSALLVSLVFGVQWLPYLLLSPFTGVVADRFDRRRIVLWGNVAMVLPAAGLGLLVQAGRIGVPSLLVLVLLGAIAQAFTQPAAAAFVPALVPAEDLHSAVALNSGLTNSTRVIGPAIGGALVTACGVEWGFYVNAVSFLAVSLACATVRVHVTPAGGTAQSFLANLRSGFAYVRGNAAAVRLLALLSFTTFFLMHAALMSIVTRDVLGGDVGTYGIISSGPGVGFVAAAVITTLLADDRQRVLALTLGAAGIATGYVVIALSRSVPFTFVGMALFGTGQMTSITVCATLLLAASADEYRGRVMGLYGTFSTGLFAVNSVVGGVLAEAIGAPWTIGLCGLVIFAILTVFRTTGSPAVILRTLEERRP